MPAGEGFSMDDRVEIDRAISTAVKQSGLVYRVYVGPLEAGEATARSLHRAAAADPSDLVLLAVDPHGREVAIVTGSKAHAVIDDRSCQLATMAMTSSFAAGDIVGGITGGLGVLAEHARRPRTLHMEQP